MEFYEDKKEIFVKQNKKKLVGSKKEFLIYNNEDEAKNNVSEIGYSIGSIGYSLEESLSCCELFCSMLFCTNVKPNHVLLSVLSYRSNTPRCTCLFFT